MRLHFLICLAACVLLSVPPRNAGAQDFNVDLAPPVVPDVEEVEPEGMIPEDVIVTEDGAALHDGPHLGGPPSMIDTPLTPVPYPGVELWEGFCNHDEGLLSVCCDDAPSAWASLDVLWLERDTGDNVVFATDDGEDGNPLLQSSQLDFDFEAGVRFNFGAMLGCTPLEITYFGTHDWDESATLTSTANDIDVLVAVRTDGAFTNADSATAVYSSDLHNLELNALAYSCCSDFTLLAGLRLISVDERLNVSAVDPVDGAASLTIDTDNTLVGLQTGGVFRRTCGRWTLGAFAKAGVFANFSDADYLIAEGDATPPAFAGTASQESDDCSFVGESLIGVDYALAAGISLRAGYQVTWIHGLSLATEQFGNTNYQGGTFAPPPLEADGEVLYDGAYLGLGWTR